MDDLEKGYRFREPAPATLEFMKETRKQFNELRGKVDDIKISLACLPEQLIEKLDKRYVTEEAFLPVKKLVYGATGVILTMVVSALLYLLIKDKF